MPKYPPSGSLFANDRKTTNGPDVTGTLEIGAELLAVLNAQDADNRPIKMRLAGWKKKLKAPKTGTFYSLSASELTDSRSNPKYVARNESSPADLDDGIPF